MMFLDNKSGLNYCPRTEIDHRSFVVFHDKLRRKGMKNKGPVCQTSTCNMSQSRKNQIAEQSKRDSESSKKVRSCFAKYILSNSSTRR